VPDHHDAPAGGHLRLSGKARQALSEDVADRLARAHDARAATRWGRRSNNADRAKLLRLAASANTVTGAHFAASQRLERRCRIDTGDSGVPCDRLCRVRRHRANAFYLDCLDADARCAAAWYGLGLVQRSLGEPVASLRALDMCLKLRPDGAPAAAPSFRAKTPTD
jgi:hypothetical protein